MTSAPPPPEPDDDPVPPRRPDASMDLLNVLRDEAIDPGYAQAAGQPGGLRHRGWVLLPATLVVGLILGLALANTWRTAPAAAHERAELIERITLEEERLDALRTRTGELSAEVRDLGRAADGLDQAQAELNDLLGLATGADPVRGPGVRITLDDGADATVRGSRVVDADLRMTVNGLWASGAEAVAINDHRLSVRTAIRNAGDAITVDYRSLNRPYLVEAIGDPRPLADAFTSSDGGRWIEGLSQHYGVVWRLDRTNEVTLPADPGLGVERATRAR